MRLVHYKSFLAASVAFSGLALSPYAGTAVAADLPVSALPVIEQVEEIGASGWYLRGDVGASISHAPDFSVNIPDSTQPTDYSNVSSDAAATFGIGIGYQFANGIRIDITADYITPKEFSAEPWNYEQVIGYDANGLNPVHAEKAKMKRESAVAMLNAYYEFSNFGKLRPYLGAGVGVAWNRISEASYSDEYLYQDYINNNLYFPNQETAGVFKQERQDKTNLAWALMAGIAYPITNQLDLDIGYKYLNLGDSRSGGVIYRDNNALTAANPEQYLETDNFSRISNVGDHQIRVGMRYKFGG